MIRETLFVLFLAVAPATAVTVVNPTAPDYCDGWEKGYPAGWCWSEVPCLPPVTPVCPVPQVNRTAYQDGYNDSFVRGREDRDEQ